MNTYIYIVILIPVLLVLYLMFKTDRVSDKSYEYDLERDGVCILRNAFSNEDIDDLKNDITNSENLQAKEKLINNYSLLHKLQEKTNISYKLQDYIWVIKKSSVHTCHRDNNGDFFNKNQQHPSYTLLIYLEDMNKCLGVIPQSHKSIKSNNFNMTDNVINLLCNKGDVILFNANLIHVGTLEKNREDHMRIQMKLTHKDDIDVLGYYQKFNKILNKENNIPFEIKKAQKNFSCMFPVLSDLTQRENINSARGSDNGVTIGFGQRLFSYLFYGNSKFYDLPNVQR